MTDRQLEALDECAYSESQNEFRAFEAIERKNRDRIQDAFANNRVSSAMLCGSTGYGFGDVGRDTLDRLFAEIVGAEDALCRAAFLSGTHALTVALFGLLRPGMTLLSAVGEPYDTLATVIHKKGVGSLSDFGINYIENPTSGTRPDLIGLAEKAPMADVVLVQRSRGYSSRDTLTLADIGEVCAVIKRANPDAVILCDNCYGEFTDAAEPCTVGADLIVGSLIKNAGGAVAETGGYIAGKAKYVELCEHRLTAPGTGRELGCVPQGHRQMYLGLYMAPTAVEQALKSAVYASHLFSLMGYSVSPSPAAPRGDIVTAISLADEQRVVSFCRAVQANSPIDSFAAPEGFPMPGYGCDVIMASGSFTNGSSIELSCDAPLRAPYTVYFQGGIHFDYSRRALLAAAKAVDMR